MLAEMLDRLHDWFAEAERTRIVKELSDARKVCALTPKGKPEWIDRPTPPRVHTTSTVDSFVAAVERYVGNPVWVAPTQVVAILDDDQGRYERITLPLALSPIFGTLDSISGKRFDQKQLIDLLRIQLAGADLNPNTFELAVRKVKFETTDVQEGEVAPNKSDAMGRSIRAQVQAADDLPDAIDLTFRPYPSLDIEATVTVSLAVTVDLKGRFFQLIPLPGELDSAKAAAVESVRAMLVEELPEVSVFCGVP